VRPPVLLLLAVFLVGTALVSGAVSTAAPAKKLRVTMIGDSVAASIDYSPDARAVLGRGTALRLDLRVCGRLVQLSCSYQGQRPSTALEAVRTYGRTLGNVLVVNVGYNESAQGYREGIDAVMRAALTNGVRTVVWVTLTEQRDIYRWTNIAIRSAAKRWQQLRVADWARESRGKPWFGSDGLHLTAEGAVALARFVRENVSEAASP
jgi:hypothetical protein